MTPEDKLAAVRMLLTKLNNSQGPLFKLDKYYEGRQPLTYLAPEVRRQVGNRLTPLVINWPRTIVDSVQRRTYVEGFRLGKGGTADDELWRIWQGNDLDEWSQLGQVDALVHGRAFVSVWANPDEPDLPRMAMESAHQVAVDYAPGGRAVRSAVKLWVDGKDQFATLYLPDSITRYRAAASASASGAAWEQEQELTNPLEAVPIVPIVNRPRVLNLDGESELTDVMPLADAINKLATDMLVTSEFHATKRRWATGIQIAGGPGGRERLQAEVAKYWDDATKDKTWLAGPGVNFGQFDEASLENFVSGINMLTSHVAAIGGLPPDDLGLNTTNPASAEARRAADTTLVLRTREKMRGWGGSYERAMRLAVAVRDGGRLADVPREYRGMETIWRDPEIQTVAQAADAAVKLVESNIIDDIQAQENVGLTPVQREAIATRRRQAMETAATADVAARMSLARKLQAEDGLTQNAALAAVGLLVAASQNTPTP